MKNIYFAADLLLQLTKSFAKYLLAGTNEFLMQPEVYYKSHLFVTGGCGHM